MTPQEEKAAAAAIRLLPCPYCGKDDDLEIGEVALNGPIEVECVRCNFGTPCPNEQPYWKREDAAAEWNRMAAALRQRNAEREE